MIRVVDYGLGNIHAFLTLYKRIGIMAAAARGPEDLLDADKVILPGVGAFDHAMQLLAASGMKEPLCGMAQSQRIPILGICVGMQLLAASSEEGQLAGLAWVPGRVSALRHRDTATNNLPYPHMGWNHVEPTPESPLFHGLDKHARFYFLHSYFFECDDPKHSMALSYYDGQFTCAVSMGNIHGVQFHPEKSHQSGVQLLRNFAEL